MGTQRSAHFHFNMAVSMRFELMLGINLNSLSKRAPSATQPTHQFFLLSSKRCHCNNRLRCAMLGKFYYQHNLILIINNQLSILSTTDLVIGYLAANAALKVNILSKDFNAPSLSFMSTKTSLPEGSSNASSISFKPFIAIQGQ